MATILPSGWTATRLNQSLLLLKSVTTLPPLPNVGSRSPSAAHAHCELASKPNMIAITKTLCSRPVLVCILIPPDSFLVKKVVQSIRTCLRPRTHGRDKEKVTELLPS